MPDEDQEDLDALNTIVDLTTIISQADEKPKYVVANRRDRRAQNKKKAKKR